MHGKLVPVGLQPYFMRAALMAELVELLILLSFDSIQSSGIKFASIDN